MHSPTTEIQEQFNGQCHNNCQMQKVEQSSLQSQSKFTDRITSKYQKIQQYIEEACIEHFLGKNILSNFNNENNSSQNRTAKTITKISKFKRHQSPKTQLNQSKQQ